MTNYLRDVLACVFWEGHTVGGCVLMCSAVGYTGSLINGLSV